MEEDKIIESEAVESAPVEKKEEEKEVVAPEEKPVEPLVYVGPGFRDSLLSTYGIFADGIPEEFKGTVYEKLFVPASKLDEARNLLKRKGSYLSVFFEVAVKEHDKQKGAK